MRLKFLILCLSVVSFASAAGAQRPTSSTIPIAPGSRVRVKARQMASPLVANFLEQRGDSLVFIEDERGRGVWTLSIAQIERLETTGGETAYDKKPIGRNALIGGGVGLAAGILFASVLSPSDSTKEYSKVLTGAVGLGIGAGIGAYLGSRVKTERWVNVPLPRQLSLIPNRRGGFSISLKYDFR